MPLDIFDEIQLQPEDLILDAVKEEVRKQLGKININKLFEKQVNELISRELEKVSAGLKGTITKQFSDVTGELKKNLDLSMKPIIEKSLIEKPDIENNLKNFLSENIRVLSRNNSSSIKESDQSLRSHVKYLIEELKKEYTDFSDKMKKKYDDLKSDYLSFHGQQWYQFGGYSPQSNDLNIGPPGIEGAWRIVKSGNDLSVERYESGVWVQKGAFMP